MTMLESQWRTGAFCPLEVPRFIADEMLQGAGQWLRVAGYDTALPVNGTRDRHILERAVNEDRWLVTRDRELARHRLAPQYVILVSGNSLEANLRDLTRLIDLDWFLAPFSRCKRCNSLLGNGNPPGTAAEAPVGASEVSHCPYCNQVYWLGSHVRRMHGQLVRFNRWRW
jgi:hypothetical protein